MTKYGNKKITIDGITFDSLLEAAFYQRLRDYKKAGKIHDFKMQRVFVLHAGIKYKLDFEIEMPDGFCDYRNMPRGLNIITKRHHRYVECKGFWTQTAKLKRKLFQADYGILEIHTAKDPWKLETYIVAGKPTKRRSRSDSTNAPGAVKPA